MKKVVVTGLGLITSLGSNLGSSWNALIEGRSGVGHITLFDAKNFRTKIAAQLPGEEFESLCKQRIKKRIANQMTRPTKMSLITAQMAVEDACLDLSAFDPKRCGIFIGSAGSDFPAKEMAAVDTFDAVKIVKSMANAPPAWISLYYNLEGPSMTLSTACSSAGYAMRIAYDNIAMGICDLSITGGTSGSILPEYISGFSDMMALSQNNENPEAASCPFDKKRDGFVMGEGAGMLILESEQSAKARGAKIYAEIKRPALLSEGYNIVSPQKGGLGMSACMELALTQAGVNTEEVGYINAHGTSTPLNDLYETQAIKRLFNQHSKKLYVSSSKSMIGHCLGAAGGVEAVITCKAIEESILPPTINLNDPDPELDLNYVPNKAINKEIKVALSNSFAFGGHNAVVPFLKFH